MGLGIVFDAAALPQCTTTNARIVVLVVVDAFLRLTTSTTRASMTPFVVVTRATPCAVITLKATVVVVVAHMPVSMTTFEAILLHRTLWCDVFAVYSIRIRAITRSVAARRAAIAACSSI
jgi:hypothetical protein